MTKTARKAPHSESLACQSKSSRKAVAMPPPPPSLKTFDVDPRKGVPPERDSAGRLAPGESAHLDSYVEIRGQQASTLGRSAWAARDIPEGEIFTCTKVRMYLRKVEDGAPNIWALRVTAHPTMKAVCNSLNWEVPTADNGLALWTGPPRAGKLSSHGYSYKETTPPCDRTAERVFRVNSNRGRKGKKNCSLFVRAVRPQGPEGIAVAQVGVKITNKVKAGQQILATYDFMEI